MEIRLLNEVIGQSTSSEVYIADHIFKYDDRFGLIGEIYRPVLLREWLDATSDDGLQRNLSRWWRDAVRRGDSRGIGEYAAALFAEKGVGIVWDLGDSRKSDMARMFTGLSEEEAPLFTCCGGGMCIDRRINWSRVVNPERLFYMLELSRGNMEAWSYFVKCV